jgi:hypothetical protein
LATLQISKMLASTVQFSRYGRHHPSRREPRQQAMARNRDNKAQGPFPQDPTACPPSPHPQTAVPAPPSRGRRTSPAPQDPAG